jgi:hypothetical protein
VRGWQAYAASSGPARQSFSVITRLSDSTASAALLKSGHITSHKRAPLIKLSRRLAVAVTVN